jgi:hypothetical protein
MSQTHTPAGLVVVLTLSAAGGVAAQQPSVVVAGGARVVGPTGPGLQPQAGTSPYQLAATAPASRGVNPFAGMTTFPAYAPRPRLAPRTGPAPVGNGVVPAAPGAANNPAAFNPGVAAPFPLVIPPALGPGLPAGNGVAFNPIFVARPAVVSAYYVPPLAPRPSGVFRSPGSDEQPNSSGSLADVGTALPAGDAAGMPAHPDAGAPFNPSSGVAFAPGEPRFLPWVW